MNDILNTSALEEKQDKLLEETQLISEMVQIDIWNSLVDYTTVYSADNIRFTFKNGQEIKA